MLMHINTYFVTKVQDAVYLSKDLLSYNDLFTDEDFKEDYEHAIYTLRKRINETKIYPEFQPSVLFTHNNISVSIVWCQGNYVYLLKSNEDANVRE